MDLLFRYEHLLFQTQVLLGSLTEEPQKRVQEEVELPENQARLANPGSQGNLVSQGNPVNQESRVNPASLVKESYQREVRYHKKRSKKVKPAKKKVKIEHTLKKNH